ncbi:MULTISPECIES: hypothetical protein [Actinomadura]|uniref:Uncharacterized protein n=1 Tax=Actinomadura yumaensis TaxID=111807 RepID=A0ABW2CN07_9ACTN|nr:hypothetical protein [Actinomadura sp. J1-007]MWK32848.1 hypothetical protein [Actinomadura sp. J1-007]
MADNWAETIADDLRRWADGRAGAGDGAAGAPGGGPVDEAGVLLLLELVREDMALAGPDELTPDSLKTLLLDVFPETVVAGEDEVPDILGTVGDLIAFLGDAGAVTGERAAELAAALDGLAPAFAEVVGAADSSERRIAADVVGGLMLADGVAADDLEAAEQWVRDFEALPEDERYARTEEYLRRAEELVVPPVVLASEAELAAAARASGLSRDVLALAAWTGERALNEHDELTGADAEAAVAALDLPVPRRSAKVEDQTDLPELDRLWWAAVEAGVIAAEGGSAAPGPALPVLESADPEHDAELLAGWLRLFDAAAVPEHDPQDGLDAIELVQNELTGVLIHLYEQEEPTPAAALRSTLLDHVTEAYEVTDGTALATAVADALDLELDDLARWGVVEDAGSGTALTPLGVWAVRELLLADGFTAPVVGELAEAPATALVEGLAWHRPDTADVEIDGWLAAREAKDAAADLLDVMRTGGAGARNLAAAVLHRIGVEAAPVVRAAQDHPLVSPYAVLWLNAAGEPARGLSRDEYLWVFVDTVAGMLESADPADAVAAALADSPPGADLDTMVDGMWRTDHPAVAEVLDALGEHHPRRTVAKAARTAAYKARSRASQTAGAAGRPAG